MAKRLPYTAPPPGTFMAAFNQGSYRVLSLTLVNQGRVLARPQPVAENDVEYIGVKRARIFRSRFQLVRPDRRSIRLRALPDGYGIESIGESGRGRYYWGVSGEPGGYNPLEQTLELIAFLVWLPYGLVMSPLILRESHQRRRNAKALVNALTAALTNAPSAHQGGQPGL